jgi:SRSO17 transposase
LQRLLAGSRWDPDEIRDDLQKYVAEKLGWPDGVLIIDDTGFLKKGTTSAGVRRQYSGTADCTENCQIGVFAAYATCRGRVLVDRELYLPKSWTNDPDRCRAAKVPENRTCATKGELARRLVLRALASELPSGWVTADSAYGQQWGFRRMLEEAGVGYVAELVRIAGPRWAIEECFQAAQNECGLDEYEVRRYVGWYRHITLAMLDHAFLAAMAAAAIETGAAETTRPTSHPSPWQKSADSWRLAGRTQLPNSAYAFTR